MCKFIKLFSVITSFLFLSSPQNSLQAEPATANEALVWYQQEVWQINKAVDTYVKSLNLEPYLQKNKLEFNLAGFESSSDPYHLAFPIGKITQGQKSYYAMFLVSKQIDAKAPYEVLLLCISTERPPSALLLRDILSVIHLINKSGGVNLDHPKLMIEHLEADGNNKIQKWTLFDGSKTASFYVKLIPNEKGETTFTLKIAN